MRIPCLLLKNRFCTQIVNKEMLQKLQRLSALKIQSEQDVRNLEEDIRLAQKIFEVDTSNVRPLYNIAEDYITCPLRDDTVEETPKSKVFVNAKKSYEGFFVAPTVGVVTKQRKSDNPLPEI